MNTQPFKDRLALLKANVADLEALTARADTEIDVSGIATLREATFTFDFDGPVTAKELSTVLTMLFQRHGIDATQITIATRDYYALVEESTVDHDHLGSPVAIRITNGITEQVAHVIASPFERPGKVMFHAPAPGQ